MKDNKCQPQPKREPHPNIVGLHDGWVAARQGEPLDRSMGQPWAEGWRLWHWIKTTPHPTRM